MKPYYYIFYRLSEWYTKYWGSVMGIGMGSTVISGIIGANLLSLVCIIGFFQMNEFIIVTTLILAMCILPFVCFTESKLSIVKERWKNESRRNRILNGYLILLYFIASILIFCLAVKYN